MTVNFHGIYTLNFSKKQFFLSELEGFPEGPFKERFQSALNGKKLLGLLQQNQTIQGSAQQILGQNQAFADMPGFNAFAAIAKEAEEAISQCEKMNISYQGTDVFLIQNLVHYLLGITTDLDLEVEPEMKQRYLWEMLKSHFLQINHILPLVYKPGEIASQFLSTHPELKILAIGCGENRKLYAGSCQSRRAEDHQQNVFSIDLSADMGPDLPVDMHDLSFWELIPNKRFDKICDHSRLQLLVDDIVKSKMTCQHVFRTLKPGGSLHMDSILTDDHKLMLRAIGFEIDSDNEACIAKKGFSSTQDLC